MPDGRLLHGDQRFRLRLLLLMLLLLLACRPAAGAASDIVPRGSATLDAFASLARAGVFGASEMPEDFLGDALYTRGQLTHLLETLVRDGARMPEDAAARAALRAALAALRPELEADHVAVPEIASAAAPVVSGFVQPELRLSGGGPGARTGVLGVYRLTALGSLSPHVRYVLSASDWAQDGRRVFDNDLGPHDFSGLGEAYLQVNGERGLTVSLGRQYDRWGPGYRGATMVSDNAPALDHLQVAFPFSLGAHLGRNYRFTRFLSTFTETGTRKYFEGQRIEYTFNPHWTADYEEAFKSSTLRSLEVSFLPEFYAGQSANFKIGGLRITNLDPSFNAFLNFSLAYTATSRLRVYGQFGIDDIQTPGRHTYRTPRKIAYLLGTAFRPAPGTNVVAEYDFADATTYSSRSLETQWQKGQYDSIGLPAGPNTRELFLRLSRRVAPGLTLAVQGRDRRRRDDSFPAPQSRDLAATVEFAPSRRTGLEVTYHDYRQQAFPVPPGVFLPGDGFTPVNAEGDYGRNLRIKEMDVLYRVFF